MEIKPFYSGRMAYDITADNGDKYVFVPKEFVQKGFVTGNTQAYYPGFTNPGVFDKANSIVLPDTSNFTEAAKNLFTTPNEGYIWKAEDFRSFMPDPGGFTTYEISDSAPAITNIANIGGKTVYGTTGSPGASYGYISDTSNGVNTYTNVFQSGGGGGGLFGGFLGSVLNPFLETAGKALLDLGPIAPLALNAITPGLGTAVGIGTAIGAGADAGDVLKSAAINQATGAVLNNLPTEVAPVDTTAATDTAFLQDMDQGIDFTNPLTDTTLDTAFLQDMDQGIQPITPVPAENPFLANMEETTATEGAGVAGADVPTGAVVSTPTVTEEATKSLTPQQISQLLKIGAGLFGGGGALAMASKGLTGGLTGVPSTAATMPTLQAPTPFTGTYSGMNPYDAAYFQQVQQNYNRLFPTAPTDVVTPLQSWYQTQYKPDTTISNKLFGV